MPPLSLTSVPLTLPTGGNIVVGQSHFIKSVEDLAEIAAAVPGARFGIAFCEASGPSLIRTEGNDPELIELAVDNARRVAAGHTFFLLLTGAFPITLLNAVKQCPEVCTVFCATGNPAELLVAESGGGRGVAGVIDGTSPLGVEDATARQDRIALLRRLGYKRS
jgi:hypothetical protein